MNIIGLNKRDDPTKRRNAAKKYNCAILEHLNLFNLYLNCNLHGLQKFSGQNIENENRNESSAINGSEIIRPLNQNRANIFSDLYYKFYMISSHNETHPGTPPTSAATSPSLPSSPPPSSTISVEGSVDGPVTGSVDGIVKGRIKKRKRTTTAEQLLKDAISHYSDFRKTGANPDYDQT
ncbi:hypothetical protein ABEB36_012331 [Hypothenemus hampei]|uniref:Uncharacterized protein n=1 Tax=Hypothenemus hampei TaxID=57062 RepID=A0ABD1EAT9_HYPHA